MEVCAPVTEPAGEPAHGIQAEKLVSAAGRPADRD